MKAWFVLLIVTVGCNIGMTSGALATSLSIYDIQYTADPTGNSSYNTQTVNCAGGIVINKFFGGKPKITLYDPAHPDGWGGLAIKDWTASKSFYNTVQIGDWVSFTNVVVEESSGNTQLQFQSYSTYTIDSRGNSLPAALSISAADLAAPVQQASPAGWFAANHNAEKYEAMYLKLNDVTVTANGLGKASDNYVLTNGAAASSWASDYMDPDTGGRLYHPLVTVGAHFESVSGICEQYAKTNTTGNSWDYYQLLTTGTGDFVVPEPASCLLFAFGLPWVIRRMGKVSSR